MNLKNKRTVLSDDAALYSHREDVSEKEKWETMTTKERLRYFADYYLVKIVVTVIVVAALASLIVTMLRPQPDIMLAVAVVEDAANQAVYEKMQTKFEEVIGLDPETQETTLDTGYILSGNDYEAWQKFSLYNMVGDLDVTIMPKTVFEKYAPGNYFAPVSERLPGELYAALEPYHVESLMRDEEGNLMPDSETVLGIDISSTWIYDEVKITEPMILIINLAPKNGDNIDELLTLLFFPDDAK